MMQSVLVKHTWWDSSAGSGAFISLRWLKLLPIPELSSPDGVTWGSADEILLDADAAGGAMGAGAALKPAFDLTSLSPCCTCYFELFPVSICNDILEALQEQSIQMTLLHYLMTVDLKGGSSEVCCMLDKFASQLVC